MDKVKPENAVVYRCPKCDYPRIFEKYEILGVGSVIYICPECSYEFELDLTENCKTYLAS